MTVSESETKQVTVKVWSGSSIARYGDILADAPEEYDLEVHPREGYVPHHEHAVVADDISNHGAYAFDVETDETVTLIVETNDSYHSPKDGFTDGRPIEGGLTYVPEGHPRHEEEPFKCEVWGRIRMRVERTEDEDAE
jgi:hypothetical protein